MTIYTDAIGNKYTGYAGDFTNILSGRDMLRPTTLGNIKDLVTSFANNIKETFEAAGRIYCIVWSVDGIQPNASLDGNGIKSLGAGGDYGFTFYDTNSTGGASYLLGISASDLSRNNIYSPSLEVDKTFYGNFAISATYGVAQISANNNDCGMFFWDDENNFEFLWVGATLGNANISVPQNRAAIYVGVDNGSLVDRVSFGVKQADSTTKRIQLDTEAGANHAINCGTDTAKLFLIEDDGAGGDGGTIGYCPNLYLSKKTGLVVGQFVSLSGLTDGGSTHGVVVSDWGDAGKIIMRVYDGVS